MKRGRSARIVATIGPASASPEMIERLFVAGVDLFRLNFSHGTHDDHRARLEIIRQIERAHGRPIGVMMDLQGPKLRVGSFAAGRVVIATGQRIRFDLDPAPGDATRVRLPHPEIFQALRPGEDLLVDDGKVRLRVLTCGADFADLVAVTGGAISNHKGVNLPNVVLPISALTEKDRSDLAFGLGLGIDWVAMSFVQRPADVAEGRKLIGGKAALLVKLEKPRAMETLDEIIELADGVMVARGDLGVESPPEDVPILQRRIVHLARGAGKPVIVATQMLESMILAPTPTRAEATDVATAVYEGADAVMLSAETAAGQYPVEAVEFMDRMLRRVQADPLFQRGLEAERASQHETASDAITAAAKQVAATVKAAAIVTYTTSGSTTLRAARERPSVPILCLTASIETARRMAMVWGVHAVHTSDVSSFAAMVEKACRIAHQEGFAGSGERIVITAGVPFGTPGATNILRIAWVQGDA
jgi:pyruvate kinase